MHFILEEKKNKYEDIIVDSFTISFSNKIIYIIPFHESLFNFWNLTDKGGGFIHLFLRFLLLS